MLKAALGLSLFTLLLAGCTDDNENSFCKPYCSDWWQAYENCAEIYDYPTSDDKKSNYRADCQNACEKAYVAVENHLEDDVEPCIDCLHSDIGDDATPTSFATSMRNNCQQPCTTPGAIQFFASFVVPPPFKNCN